MLIATCVGTNNLPLAGQFYDAVLETLNMHRMMENENEIGYSLENDDTVFYVLLPFNNEPATSGNGTQISFQANSPNIVDKFYNAAIKAGGKDEGKPGPRDYAEGFYGAYVRDLDGNKLHVFHIPANP